MNRLTRDAEVINRDEVDEEERENYDQPWNVVFGDGLIIGFKSDIEALAVQRAHRLNNGRDPETGKLLKSNQRPCAICGKQLEHVSQDGNQPYDALEFVTGGHYGSTVFDPMDGTRMLINICDVHVREWIEMGRTAEYHQRGDYGW